VYFVARDLLGALTGTWLLWYGLLGALPLDSVTATRERERGPLGAVTRAV
jgi:hypothetical protein